jgi:large subunit ribosomal protein L21
MYAIITAGASQHIVNEGETLKVDLLKNKKKGDKLTFDKVLFVGNGDKHTIGQPFVNGAKVEASVVDPLVKGDKIFPLKRRPGDYVKHQGHRAKYTTIKIEKISG